MTIRVPLVTVLVVLVFAAIGAGTAVGVMLWEPWDGDEQPTATEQQVTPTETGPTQAELDAQRQREEDSLCLEAQQADAAAEAAYYAKAASGGLGAVQQRLFDAGLGGYRPSPSIQEQIDRYC